MLCCVITLLSISVKLRIINVDFCARINGCLLNKKYIFSLIYFSLSVL